MTSDSPAAALQKRWVLPSGLPDSLAESLAAFSPIERQILHRRGIRQPSEAQAFLEPGQGTLEDPFALLGMQEAVERVRRALHSGERMGVYGDYDVDGVTGVALLLEALRDLGGDAIPYIPNRFEEGYGLGREGIDALRLQGVGLVITVDCGVRSVVEVEHARATGVEVIVTDHHQPAESLPPALAVINPKQEGDHSREKNLAGVGLAYKLALGIAQVMKQPAAESALELAAIGTIADMAPLAGENRTIVAVGLKRLARTARPGMQALAHVSRLQLDQVRADSIAFIIAPRLNAAGRLDTAMRALQSLMTQDPSEAEQLASELDHLNRERQRLTRETVDLVRELAFDGVSAPQLFFASSPDFNEGVIGLAAARLVDEFYRPAIVAALRGDIARGSARSIPGFHITQALDACSDLTIRHGGHESAAGFTLRARDLQALEERLRRLAGESLTAEARWPQVTIDALVDFRDLTGSLLAFTERLEPCGQGNPPPLFASRGVSIVKRKAVGVDAAHLKLTLSHHGRIMDAIAFRQGRLAATLPERVDVAYQLGRNRYLGVETMQLNVQDIRPADESGSLSV